jgi:hypothetical protein
MTATHAHALTVTDTVQDNFLVTGIVISTAVNVALKMAFENKTAGTNLSLCAGSPADFQAQKCTIILSNSGEPGFQFLTIIDTKKLSGKDIYVINNSPTKPATFSLTVE